MKNVKKMKIEVSHSNPIPDILEFVRHEMTTIERVKMAEEILKSLPEAPSLVKEYAELDRMRENNGGRLMASEDEIWELARKDAGAEVEGGL